MKITTILTALAAITITAQAATQANLELPDTQVTQIGVTNHEPVYGSFRFEWRVETNSTPTVETMRTFQRQWMYATNFVTTNVTVWRGGYEGIPNIMGPYQKPCPLEHADGSEHVDYSYVQSNLWSVLAWRGRTNEDCLESICIKTNAVRWHWKKIREEVR